MPCDISIPKSYKWYQCKSIFIDSPLEILEGNSNPLTVTLQSASGCMGHVNLYYGTPGTVITQCVGNDVAPLNLISPPYNNNNEPIVSVPAGSTAYDPPNAPSNFMAGSVPGWPSTVMIVAKAVLVQSSTCQAGTEPSGWDATNPQIACCRFTLVTQEMVRSNLSVLLPPIFEPEATSTAFAMSLTTGREGYEYGRPLRTTLRAIVIGNERRDKHIDRITRELILRRAGDEKRGVHGTWTPSPKVRLALGKERMFLDGPQTRPASLGHVGPISPEMTHHLMAGLDWQSERDVQVDLSLHPGEVKQALIEVPVPPPGEFNVVRVEHRELESGTILQHRTFIVEPHLSRLRRAPGRAA